MRGRLSIFWVVLLAAAVIPIIFLFVKNKKIIGGFIVTKENTSSEPQNFLTQAAKLPIEAKAPSLRGISGWINSGPLSNDDLRGKVVLVDFWTYSCINCIRTLPHLNEWHKKYKDNGLVILGLHSPEFDFEKKKENVEAAVKKYDVKYPVALDSEHESWKAFANQYWPAHYLVDVAGNIRYHSFGEGHYAETEAAIQNLLLEAKLLTLDKITKIKEAPADASFQDIGTPEIYLGYSRINNVGNIDPDTKPDLSHVFSEPKLSDLLPSRFYFAGAWTIGPEFSELSDGKGKLILRYKAGKVNIVAETKDGRKISAEIFLDGKSKGIVPVSSPQLYNLIDTGSDYNWHTLEIRIPHPGFRIFTFTFG